MSETLRNEGIGEASIICAEKWDKTSEKQRKMWVAMSDAPLTTPTNREWNRLPFYCQDRLFTAWAEARI